MCHLIEVYAFAVISEYSVIILRKLPHNLVRTQGFELRCVGLNTEVANLRPGKRQTEQEETDLTQRWFHPIPSPGSCECQQTHGKSGRKANESVKPGATVLSFSLNRPTERVGCSNDGWWCSMRPPNCLFLTYFQPSLEILWRRHIRRDVKFIEPLNRRKVKTQRLSMRVGVQGYPSKLK